MKKHFGLMLSVAGLMLASATTAGLCTWVFGNNQSTTAIVDDIKINEFNFLIGIYPTNGGFYKLDDNGNEVLVSKKGFRLLEGTYDDNVMSSSFTYSDYTTEHIYYEVDSKGKKRTFNKADGEENTVTVTAIEYPEGGGATILKLPTQFGYYYNGVLDTNQVYDVSGYDSCPFHTTNMPGNNAPDSKLANVSLFGHYENTDLNGNGVSEITEINLPSDSSSLKYISDRAFAGLPAIKNLDLSNATSLQFIGQWAFTRDYQLEKVKLPSNIKATDNNNPNNYKRSYRYLNGYTTATDTDYDNHFTDGEYVSGKADSIFSSNDYIDVINTRESHRFNMYGMLSYSSIKNFDFRDYPNITHLPTQFLCNDLSLKTLIISNNIVGGNNKNQAFGFMDDAFRPESYDSKAGALTKIYYEGSLQTFKELKLNSKLFIDSSTIPSRFPMFGSRYDSATSQYVYDETLADPYIYSLTETTKKLAFFSINTKTVSGVKVPNTVSVNNYGQQKIINI
jgi:hypothetical protein